MVCCWWCKHDVGNAEIKIPTGEIYKRRKNLYDGITVESPLPIPPPEDPTCYNVEGYFCSFECGKAYILQYKPTNFANLLHVFCHMRRMTLKEDGINPKDIIPLKKAPTWKALKEFGGSLTIEEFRDSDKEWILIPKNYMFEPVNIQVKKREITERPTTWKENKQLISEATKSNDQLKIKRTKPRTNVSGFGNIITSLGGKKI